MTYSAMRAAESAIRPHKCGMFPLGRLFPNHCLPRGSIPHFHDRDITPELELFWLLAKTRTNTRPSS